MPEWISVKERLPDRRKAVLVYTPLYLNIFEAYLTEDNEWLDFASSEHLPFYAEVTHWMPLPEPPKKGGGEDGK